MLEPVDDSSDSIDRNIKVLMLECIDSINVVVIENDGLKMVLHKILEELKDAKKLAIEEKGRNNAMMQESVELEELNNNKIKAVMDHYKQLQVKVDRLQKDIDNLDTSLTKERYDCIMKIDELQERINTLQKEKRDLKSKTRDLQRELSDVLAWNKDLTQNNSMLRKRIEQIRLVEEQRLARENDSPAELSDSETEDVNNLNEKSEKRPSSVERNCTSPSQRERERHNYDKWSRSNSCSSNDEPPTVQNNCLSIQEEIQIAERNMPVITPANLQEDTTAMTSTKAPVVQFLDEIGLVSYMK